MKREWRSLVIDDPIVKKGLGLRESPFCAAQAGMQQLREFALLRIAAVLRKRVTSRHQAVDGRTLLNGRVNEAIAQFLLCPGLAALTRAWWLATRARDDGRCCNA